MTHTTKHTPGPWHLEYDVDGIPLTIIGADNSAIGIVETWNAHTEGNRHLLTAAPAMYEAGQPFIAAANLLEVTDDGAGECYVVKVSKQEYQALRAALAQADGKQ